MASRRLSSPLLSLALALLAPDDNTSDHDPFLDESVPLLSDLSSVKDDEDGSDKQDYQKTLRKRKWQKLLAFCLIGILFSVAFRLVFLPRTSLSRDLKRLHFDKLTKSDLKRIYLNSFDHESAKDTFRRRSRSWANDESNSFLAGENQKLVKDMIKEFKLFGYKTKDIEVDKYEAWLNRPIKTGLSLLKRNGSHNEVVFSASLQEGINKKEIAFHGYSPSGNVTAKFAFANFGTVEDFEAIKAQGIALNNTIVIMRYGKILRGLKVKNAEHYGAVGAILYSDAVLDHNFTTKNGYMSFPEGPARNPTSFERGSVEYFSEFPGDPSTPGFAVKPNVKSTRFHRIKRQTKNLTSVPGIVSIPVSAKEIEPILSKLNGTQPNFNHWNGSLNDFDYSVGPSEGFELELTNMQNYTVAPITNVIVKIPGILSDEGIIIGNHRDSWTHQGGSFSDAHSGSSIMFEIAKSFHKLLDLGWKPLRTIYFISWDAEEYGMVGSTEYGEYNSKKISDSILAYINLDVAISGSKFRVQANHLLSSIIYKTANQISYSSDQSLYDYWAAQGNAKEPQINLIGGGNDYAIFQNHLGIPSVDVGFKNDGGVKDAIYHYHSTYDNLEWIEMFADPGYKHHEILAKFTGLLTLNLDEREMIGYNIQDFSNALSVHFDQLIDINKHTVSYWKSNKHIIDDTLVKSLFNGEQNEYYTHYLKSIAANGSSKKPEFFTFAKLLDFISLQIKDFSTSSLEFDNRLALLQEDIIKDYAWFNYYKKFVLLIKIKFYNYKVKKFDKRFLYPSGLDSRPWMKYILVAPNKETGYDGQYLPGLSEALEEQSLDRTVKWLIILSKSLSDAKTVF